MKILKCCRCGQEWASRSESPYRCGKCKSPYWDRPRENANVEDRSGKAGSSEVRGHGHQAVKAVRRAKQAVRVGGLRSSEKVQHGPDAGSSGDEKAVDAADVFQARPSSCPECHALNGNHFRGCKKQ